MSLTLSQLKPKKGSTKNKKRLGRGNGSGLGTYSGRGQKGQGSRKGKKFRASFEGGQTSFLQKFPKLKGFKNSNYIEYFAINLNILEKSFDENSNVNAETLKEKNILKNLHSPYRILGTGNITKKLVIKTYGISKSAKEKIEKVGGEIEILKYRKSIKNKKNLEK
jgi:large subunit ribosomal protein L15